MINSISTWLDDRTAAPTLFHKLRHWTVPGGSPYTRLIPAMVIFLFIVQVITGILLWLVYSPSAQSAWESLFYMQFHQAGGWLIRGIHHFAAQLMPVLLGCYLLCLIFTGRYRAPREFVFWTVFVLFLFSLGFSLTGDLLSWTLGGFHGTLVRVRFLQMLPCVGEPLFRIVCGGSEFGTLTITRFLVLHILILGGGFFALLCLWQFFDYRAARELQTREPQTASAQPKRIPLFSDEILKYSIAWLVVMGIVLLLVYRAPIINSISPGTYAVNENLPREALLGVHLGAPADPTSSYDAARPAWSFRALYHFANLQRADGTEFFPGEFKFIPVFVVTSIVGFYVFMLPFIGRIRIGHYFNLGVTGMLFVSLCYLTFASFHHDYRDPSMQGYRDAKAAQRELAERAIELGLLKPIPPTGILTLTQNDPFIQGPILYKQHCIMCHAFEPLAGEMALPNFRPIFSDDEPVAPNLYNPIRREWIAGFLCPDRIRSADFFGNTNYRDGSMVRYVRGDMQDEIEDAADLWGVEDALDQLIDFLLAGAQRDAPRDVRAEPLSEEQIELWELFSCSTCHVTYQPDSRRMNAPNLQGYMSRQWMIDVIANPTTERFYGPITATCRDRMPAYHPNAEDAVMTMREIELLTDWLRGTWAVKCFEL